LLIGERWGKGSSGRVGTFLRIKNARLINLSFQLSYNWHFEIENKDDPSEAAKLFCVPDFIGDMCKAIASQIRGAVSTVSFDDFHKNSAKIIRYN